LPATVDILAGEFGAMVVAEWIASPDLMTLQRPMHMFAHDRRFVIFAAMQRPDYCRRRLGIS